MNKEEIIFTLYASIKSAKEQRLQIKYSHESLAGYNSLRNFQIQRLTKTHKDLLDSPATSKAAHFFLEEIYGNKDLTQRDKELERFVPMIEKTFPLNTLEVIAKSMILDSLTELLDAKMVQTLGINFDENAYIDAFREKTSQEDRSKQLKLLQEIGSSLCYLVQIPFLSTTLKLMTIPAKIAGLSHLHEFLYTGFYTFKETYQPQKFVNILIERETKIFNHIYGKQNNPFLI